MLSLVSISFFSIRFFFSITLFFRLVSFSVIFCRSVLISFFFCIPFCFLLFFHALFSFFFVAFLFFHSPLFSFYYSFHSLFHFSFFSILVPIAVGWVELIGGWVGLGWVSACGFGKFHATMYVNVLFFDVSAPRKSRNHTGELDNWLVFIKE